MQQRFEVGAGAQAVPEARRAATKVLGEVDPPVLDAAQLVVSELVSNAVLHGSPPVTLVVEPLAVDGSTGARVEVHDCSRTLPVRPHQAAEGLTGRGLALIDAVAARWGVDATSDGKSVWAELTPVSVEAAQPTDVDVDALLAGAENWEDLDERPRYTITLGDVPTDLLLAAKAHVDSVVRELSLSAGGAESGMTPDLPPHLAKVVADVTNEWAEARQAIKRQAIAAAERGEQRTTLTLTLPLEAAESGERYLAALEQADTYAHASRLLTLAAPPQHRAFRRWYITALVDGLRRAAAGEQGVRAASFEAHLLREIDHLAALQQVSQRSARLQRVTAALSGALEQAAVAETVLSEAAADLAALRGVLVLATPNVPRVAASTGYPPEQLDALLERWSVAAVPMTRAWQTSTAVWLESRQDADAFPDLAELEPDAAAACAVPLTVAGRLVGVLGLTFLDSRLFSDDERAFVRALSAVAAQSMERADLYEQQADVADRLTRLQSVTGALAAAETLDEVLDVAIAHATGLVGANRAALCLLRDDARTVETVRMVPSLGPDHGGWQTFSIDAPVPASEALRTGEFVEARNLAERDDRWPAVREYGREVEHSLVIVPLHGEGTTLGVISLSFPHDRGGTPERAFLMAFADACGQAIERVRAAERARVAAARLSLLARASAELSTSLDPERTLTGIARLAVPEFADWCVVHLLQDGELRPIAMEHRDPAKTDVAWSAQRRWPQRLTDPAGVARVVRTGEPQLIRDVAELTLPPQRRAAEYERLLAEFSLRSALIVPLAARGRTLGALTFITAESERRYDDDDLAFALDLAGRAAVALDNARLFAAASERLAFELPDDAPGDVDAALNAAEVGRFSLRLDDHQLESDERLAGFFGFTDGDTPAHFAQFVSRIHPDDRTRVQSGIAAAVERRSDYAVEHRVQLPDGEVRWLSVRGRVLVDDAGNPECLAGVAYDTTAARDVRERTARLLETMSDAFFRLDREWRFAYVNTQAERLLFRGREELLGRELWREFPQSLGTDFERNYRRALDTGLQVSFEEYYAPLDAWFEVRASPDSDGLSVFFHDVTARKRAEQAQEAATERLRLLAEATRELVGALDAQTVLARLTRVLVPALGDWAITGSVRDMRVETVHSAHADAARAAVLDQAARQHRERMTFVPRIARMLHTGRPELVVRPDAANALAASPDLPDVVRHLGLGSALLVPLRTGEAVLGFLVLVRGPERPPFDDEDLASATDIAGRAALAIQNAELFERQRRAVEVLQRSLLTALPQPDGLHVAARYRAAAQEAQVGGDWYDAFQQPDGATVLVIGDVIGHDVSAAAAMGQLRSLLRGTAYDRPEPPADVLARVDAALRGLRIDTLATALVARLELPDGAPEWTLSWASAGHPPAMLRRVDGTIDVLDGADDLLLGLDVEVTRHERTALLRPGDTLLLYTDGLVERRDSVLTEGLTRLRTTFADVGYLPVDEMCDVLLARLLPEEPDDDVALVALRVVQ